MVDGVTNYISSFLGMKGGVEECFFQLLFGGVMGEVVPVDCTAGVRDDVDLEHECKVFLRGVGVFSNVPSILPVMPQRTLP